MPPSITPRRRVGHVEQAIEEILPPLAERKVALELVEHGEPGRQVGLDRELVEQPAGERMQRADRGVVEIVERNASIGAGRVGRLGERV